MNAQNDYQQALKEVSDLAAAQSDRVSGRPAPYTVNQIFQNYGNAIAGPMTDDLKSGSWKKWESWQLAGCLNYLSTFGTSAAVPTLREIETGFKDSAIQQQAKDLADLLATLDVAVTEARKLKEVQDAISSGDKAKMSEEMLLALAQLDPDWPKRAANIQRNLFELADDSFPAINELASGAVSKADVTNALISILFSDVSGTGPRVQRS